MSADDEDCTGRETPSEHEFTKGRAVATASLVFFIAVGEGYDFSVFSTVLLRLQEVFGVDAGTLGFLASCHYLGMIIGASASGPLADHCGRKRALFVTCCFLVFGCLIIGLAPNIPVIITGRIISGIGFGLGIPLGGLYIVETAPKNLRGSLGAGFGSMLAIGLALGSIAGAVLLDTWEDWRVMILIGCFLPLPPMVSLLHPWFPESPRWLVMCDNPSEALLALERLGSGTETAQRTLENISKEIHAFSLNPTSKGIASQSKSILCPAPQNRPRILAAIGTTVSMFLCGMIPLNIYFPLLLKVDLSRRMAVTVASVIGSSAAIATLLGVNLPDLLGRRRVLLLGYSLVFLMFTQLCWVMSPWSPLSSGETRGWWTVFWIAIGSVAFHMTCAPVSLFYSGEVLPTEMRAMGMGVGNMMSRIVAFMLTYSFPIWWQASRWMTYLAFAMSNLIIIVFVCLFVIETRGLGLEQIQEIYSEKAPLLAKV